MRFIKGVGLVLFDQDGRILMFSTSSVETDCGRTTAKLSVPATTTRTGESDLEALVRLIVDEIGNGTVEVPPKSIGVFDHKLSETVTERLSLFIGKCGLGFDVPTKIQDFVFFGWMPPQAIINRPAEQIRPGIEPIISSCFAS